MFPRPPRWRRLALIHNIAWSLGAYIGLSYIADHAPAEIWHGLRTSMLLTEGAGFAESWFVTVMAFAIYSFRHVVWLAAALCWLFFWRRRYLISMFAAWLPLANVGLLWLLFGLPLLPH